MLLEAVANMSAHVKTELGADEDYVEAVKVWQGLCAIYIYIYICMHERVWEFRVSIRPFA